MTNGDPANPEGTGNALPPAETPLEKADREMKAARRKRELDEKRQLLLYPEYAIGQNLITRDEFNAIYNQYYAQSQLSFSLILPLLFLYGALLLDTRHVSSWVYLCIIGFIIIAFLTAMDRMHKYYSELHSLVASRYRRFLKAKKDEEKAAKEKKDKEAPLATAITHVKHELNKDFVALNQRLTEVIATIQRIESQVKATPGGPR